MKQLLLIPFFLTCLRAYSQTIAYKFSIEEITEQSQLKDAWPSIAGIFDDRPRFNSSSSEFIIQSEIDIEEADFIAKMENKGYHVNFFEKNYIKRSEGDGL
ncbi:MAG: hypothetical protein ACHQFW_11565 [Chitinophagales bacterium]